MKKVLHLSFLIALIFTMTALAQENKPVEAKPLLQGFIPSLKISGVSFFDYFYNIARDTNIDAKSAGKEIIPKKVLSGPKDLYGFQIRRIHFTLDYEFAKNFMVRTRLESDGGQIASTATKSSAKTDSLVPGNFAPYIKDAYIEWREIFKGSKLKIGLQPTIGNDISESIWGYRSLEKMIMDLRGILNTRDLAISLQGKIDADGMYNYAIMYGNSSGIKNETDKYKRLSGLFFVKPVKNLNVTLYGEYNFQPSGHVGMTLPSSTVTTSVPVDSNLYNTALFIGYGEKDKYFFGVEASYSMTQNGFQNKYKPSTTYPGGELQTKAVLAMSIMGYYYFMPELGLIVRYDYYDPNLSSDSKGDSRQFLVAGVNYRPDKNFHIIPNIQYEMYETQPGTTGKPDLKFAPSLNARVTFAYYFSN